MRSTQVYKWNWNRKRGHGDQGGSEMIKRIRYKIVKLELDGSVTTTILDGGPIGTVKVE